MEWLFDFLGPKRMAGLCRSLASLVFVLSILGVVFPWDGAFDALGGLASWAGLDSVAPALDRAVDWYSPRSDILGSLMWLLSGLGVAVGTYRYGDGENGAVMPTSTAALLLGLLGSTSTSWSFAAGVVLVVLLGTLFGWRRRNGVSYRESVFITLLRLVLPIVYPVLLLFIDRGEEDRGKDARG